MRACVCMKKDLNQERIKRIISLILNFIYWRELLQVFIIEICATSWENLFVYAIYEQQHPRSLISAFVVRCLDSIIPLLAIAEISRP